MKVFLSIHADDECLFGALTLLREKPLVVIPFDGYVQAARGANITAEQRRAESLAACKILGCNVVFLGFSDARFNERDVQRALMEFREHTVYAPAEEEDGHAQHNLIGRIAREHLNVERFYMTYTRHGKSTGDPVPYEPDWPRLKLLALACYESQIRLPSTAPHFMRSQLEYYQPLA